MNESFFYYTATKDVDSDKESVMQMIKKIIKQGLNFNKKDDDKSDSNEELSHASINLFKSGGIWKWIGVFTNSFRDDDIIPEIFSSAAHRRYVNKVDSGEYDLPELWLYHEPLWKLGKASFVALDEVSDTEIFVIAGGDIDADKSFVAEKIAMSDQPLKMSHAVPAEEIVRNTDDETVFDAYWSKEVTIVPVGKEANPLTVFGVIGEINMIAQEKRAQINQALGTDDSFLDRLEALNKNVAEAERNIREHKSKKTGASEEVLAEATEVVATEAVETTIEAEAVEEIQETTEVTESTIDEAENNEADQIITEDSDNHVLNTPSFDESLIEVLHTMSKTLQSLHDRVKAIESSKPEEVVEEAEKAVEEPEQVKAVVPDDTPAAFNIYQVIKSGVIGDPATKVDGRSKLSKSAPMETQPQEEPVVPGVPFLNGLIAGSRK